MFKAYLPRNWKLTFPSSFFLFGEAMVYPTESAAACGQRGCSGLNYHFCFSNPLSYLDISAWAQAHWLVSNAHYPFCSNSSFFPKIVSSPSTLPSPDIKLDFNMSWPSETSDPSIRGSVHLWFVDYHMKGKSCKTGQQKHTGNVLP